MLLSAAQLLGFEAADSAAAAIAITNRVKNLPMLGRPNSKDRTAECGKLSAAFVEALAGSESASKKTKPVEMDKVPEDDEGEGDIVSELDESNQPSDATYLGKHAGTIVHEAKRVSETVLTLLHERGGELFWSGRRFCHR